MAAARLPEAVAPVEDRPRAATAGRTAQPFPAEARCSGALPHERANGIILEIGWTDCDTGRRFIQPDSWVTGDGFTVATAPSGPNRGMHYVSSATLYMRRESTYNAGMFPTAPLVVIANA